MIIDKSLSNHAIFEGKKDSFAIRKAKIIERIKKHYSVKLKRNVNDTEAQEIADNLLGFAKAIYGIKE
jgi:ArsR family metal-binding transcriptional regulator